MNDRTKEKLISLDFWNIDFEYKENFINDFNKYDDNEVKKHIIENLLNEFKNHNNLKVNFKKREYTISCIDSSEFYMFGSIMREKQLKESVFYRYVDNKGESISETDKSFIDQFAMTYITYFFIDFKDFKVCSTMSSSTPVFNSSFQVLLNKILEKDYITFKISPIITKSSIEKLSSINNIDVTYSSTELDAYNLLDRKSIKNFKKGELIKATVSLTTEIKDNKENRFRDLLNKIIPSKKDDNTAKVYGTDFYGYTQTLDILTSAVKYKKAVEFDVNNLEDIENRIKRTLCQAIEHIS